MNQQILSQDEVDALLQGITGESQKLERRRRRRRRAQLRPGEPGAHRARPHADDGDHQRALRAQHPRRPVQLIRKSPEVSIGGIKVQKYSAFLREIVVPTNFNIVGPAAARHGLIVCDPTLVFAVIDALFGGAGKYHTRIEGRDFSPTEQRVIQRLVEYHRAPSTARPGTASTRSSWSTSARRCSRSSPTSPRPARSWCRPRSRSRSATPAARSTSAFRTRRSSRSATCCIRPSRATPASPTGAGSTC